MSLDFSNAQLPRLLPLEASYSENEVEADLKRLFIDLFNSKLSAESFDANVLGVAHLGSFDLVRKAINIDGLALLQGDREEAATRYLYRAWKSGNVQGRGIHFLRTYLQLLYPNLCRVDQLWHDKTQAYPKSTVAVGARSNYWLYAVGETGLKLNGAWKVGASRPEAEWAAERARIPNAEGMFLTSRIEIALDFSVTVQNISTLMHILRSVIPAKFVLQFRFWKIVTFGFKTVIDVVFLLQRQSYFNTGKWNVLSTSSDSWKLDGSRKIAEYRASCINSTVRAPSTEVRWLETIPPDKTPEYYIPPQPTKLGYMPRKLNGSWKLGCQKIIAATPIKLDGSWRLGNRKMTDSARIGNFKILNIATPILLPQRMARLSLNGRWKLGGFRSAGFELNIYRNGVRQSV